MKNKTIAIIGHFGGREDFLDGQTIKTKILYNELRKATDWNIIKVDTYYKSRNPIKLVFDTLKAIFRTKDIIILLSGNGMRIYFPILTFCTKVFKTRVYHDVIGGNLDTYASRYPKFQKYLNSFRVNWVETNSLKLRMEKTGVSNCEVIPNFKRLNIAEVKNESYAEPYKFCVFSRVMKEKGIEDAIEAIENINAETGRDLCLLDIYGHIDGSYCGRFQERMSTVTKSVQYKGTVSYEKSVETIKDYYALLFPTYWKGEGFPGTIVDAFSAGLPVIATDWNCNSEIITNRVNGILYPKDGVDTLKDAIRLLIDKKNKIYEMKCNCVETARAYQPDTYIKHMVLFIENEGKK